MSNTGSPQGRRIKNRAEKSSEGMIFRPGTISGHAWLEWMPITHQPHSIFLPLPNGIPGHDTFTRVFSILDPTSFQECFLRLLDF
jgi:hypothetical protein